MVPGVQLLHTGNRVDERVPRTKGRCELAKLVNPAWYLSVRGRVYTSLQASDEQRYEPLGFTLV